MLPRAIDNAKTAQHMLATLMPDEDSDEALFPEAAWTAGTHPESGPAHTN